MIYNILDNGEALVKFGSNSERKLQQRQLMKVGGHELTCTHINLIVGGATTV
jgi:hypothetical protein